ncbi:hypothetical protein [Dehalogenimonas alkenigignens]|uniref:hypothetical protein n=1 Tax=Dehalogenimonas alkenigignens TaxID=1217799 RepID=UPI000D5810D9|nr:hypothetical protein [Dehalogenimonas alkenigignens]PVV83688.1 hypothetical protein DD509_05495 [Dehalogenimonas alkenigignens]
METELETTIEEEAELFETETAVPESAAELTARLISREAELARLSRELADKDDLIKRLNKNLNAAVGAYRGSTAALHRDLPEELIEGDSVSAVDESLRKAMDLVPRVKSALAQAAPPLVAVSRSRPAAGGLSPEDKIRRGLAQ